ncbi:MAG TPA: adenylate/guanylate cyclase domain-containing protein [Cyanobacteria bacterium UBA8553]|nr:adenylate/guanylate cyclase domain-containing protein [Cyanobacteria bacterium UBA8553]
MWKQLQKQIWEWRGVWTVAPTVAGMVIALRFLGWLQPWEWAALDQSFRWRPLEPIDQRIVIVGISEEDLKKAAQWPIPDAVLAKLLEKIKAQNPRAIGLDLYRDLPVEPGNADLVKVFQTTPNLIGIEKIDVQNPNSAVAPPPVLNKLDQVGFNNVVVDPDGKQRRVLLYLEKKGNVVASFSMRLAGLYLDAQKLVPQAVKSDPNAFQWGKGIFERFKADDGGYVRVDDAGYQILLNYRGPARSFRTVSMTDVLENKIPGEWGRDRIIMIGSTATSLNDFFYTPYSGDRITTPERTPGVEVLANITSQLISTALDGRPLIKTWSEPVEILWIVLWSTVGAVLSWQSRYAGGVGKLSFYRGFATVMAGGILLGSTYVAFLGGWWIPVVPPILALSGSAIAITAYIARTAREIRKAFGRYLTDEVVASLLESPEGLQLGGDRRKITILTSDLRGFTAIAERLQPEEVVKILNIYLGCMTEVISQYQGTIDEFMGDGILVLFGAPTLREDDAERAVACAVAMQLAMPAINEKMKDLNVGELEMGIGINTGEVVVGNIGSEKRTKYSVIGSHVNLTYRIESYTVGGQILISESTLKDVESIVRIDETKEVQPKGVKQPITIYDIGGIHGKHNLFITQEEEVLFDLPGEICLQFHYALLDGKHIDDSLFKGSLVKLSAKGAELRSDIEAGNALPEPLSNIKLNLLSPSNPRKVSEDIYAKVLKKEADNSSFCIHFTSLPPDVEAMLDQLYQKSRESRS